MAVQTKLAKSQLEDYYKYLSDGKSEKWICETLDISQAFLKSCRVQIKAFCLVENKRLALDNINNLKKLSKLWPLTKERREMFEDYIGYGYTDNEVADMIGVPPIVVHQIWLVNDEKLLSIKKAASLLKTLDWNKAMHKRAVGFEYDETTNSQVVDKKGKVRKLKSIKTMLVIPSVDAAKFLLVNKRDDFSFEGSTQSSDNKGAILDAIEKMATAPD